MDVQKSNVIEFPVKMKQVPSEHSPQGKLPNKNRLRSFVHTILWPMIRWYFYLDLGLSFLKMILHTNPNASNQFMGHLFGFMFLVSVYLYCKEMQKPMHLRSRF